MTSRPELVDNLDGNTHRPPLGWLVGHRDTPMAVATGYVNVVGLFGFASVIGETPRPTRLLLGTAPDPGLGERVGEGRLAMRERLQRSLDALTRDREFRNFPSERRATLERVNAFLSCTSRTLNRVGSLNRCHRWPCISNDG